MKGELGRKDQGKRGKSKRKVWVKLVKKELQKHVKLLSGHQIPVPLTSIQLHFWRLKDWLSGGIHLLSFILISLIKADVVILTH